MGAPSEDPSGGSACPPTWYAAEGGRWREAWTMLHLPYTGMVLAFVVLGASLAPQISLAILGWLLVAYFLGLGLGAHFLDQISGAGTRYAAHWKDRELVLVGGASLTLAAALGIVGSLFVVPRGTLALVVVQCIFALGYPLGRRLGGILHRDGWFALSWGAFPFVTGFYTQTGTLTAPVVLTATAVGGIALVEILLSRHCREMRREHRERTLLRVGRNGTHPFPGNSLHRPEAALKALVATSYLLAAGALLSHYLPVA
jgi:hypothetical protein